jgi:hypothetical protein
LLCFHGCFSYKSDARIYPDFTTPGGHLSSEPTGFGRFCSALRQPPSDLTLRLKYA